MNSENYFIKEIIVDDIHYCFKGGLILNKSETKNKKMLMMSYPDWDICVYGYTYDDVLKEFGQYIDWLWNYLFHNPQLDKNEQRIRSDFFERVYRSTFY
jgi:hypothetical protein